MITEGSENYKENIVSLLQAEKLPTDDLPETLDNFMVAMEDNEMVGVIGLEIYENYGLLRSLAVIPAFRSQGVAAELLKNLENLATAKTLTAIYLLTETAPDYFARKGYQIITRGDVPAEIKQSSEFSYTCPLSAIVMKKSF
ncbi:MAG: arsenic resistance N-acetyltransferase ArsN2 [Mucilaginibacter sp.]